MGFKLEETRDLPLLGSKLSVYREEETGAMHAHIEGPFQEISFCSSFGAPPESDKGEAHVLEHLVLSGSKNFPVKDPFFGMIKRSLASFMNAMTYSDRIVFPFATALEKDFWNLLDIYLDASFFPELNEFDFGQEASRIRKNEKTGALELTGVVYNEMKGNMAEAGSAFWRGLAQKAYAGSHLAFNSGGDPLNIPDLALADLQAFHKKNFSPAKALFLTAGPLPIEKFHKALEEKVFKAWNGPMEKSSIGKPALSRLGAGGKVEIPAGEDPVREFKAQWVFDLGETKSASARAESYLLQQMLLGDASAPLKKAIESAGFGAMGICGIDNQGGRILLHLGMDGLTKDEIAKAKKVVWGALEEVSAREESPEKMKTILDAAEMSYRDTSGGRMPFALSLLLSAAGEISVGVSAVEAFDADKALADLKEAAKDKNLRTRLVKEKILNNKNCSWIEAVPSDAYIKNWDTRETERLKEAKTALTPERERAMDQMEAGLKARQGRENSDKLPMLTREDLAQPPKELADFREVSESLWERETPLNGLVCAQRVARLGALSDEDAFWLSALCDLSGTVGSWGRDHTETSAERKGSVKGLHLALEEMTDWKTGGAFWCLAASGMGLASKSQTLIHELDGLCLGLNVSDEKRLAYEFSNWEQDIREHAMEGADLAPTWANSGFDPKMRFEWQTSGSGALARFLDLEKRISAGDKGAWEEVRSGLKKAQSMLEKAMKNSVLALGGSQSDLSGLRNAASASKTSSSGLIVPAMSMETSPMEHKGFIAGAPVNEAYWTLRAPRMKDEGAGAAALACSWLKGEKLHHLVREVGGAYGSSCAFDPKSGMVRFSSYRDPRLAGTFGDFKKALEILASGKKLDPGWDEARIVCFKSLLMPSSPKSQWGMALTRRIGRRDQELEKIYRADLLAAGPKEASAFAQSLIDGDKGLMSARISKDKVEEAQELGLKTEPVIPQQTSGAPAP